MANTLFEKLWQAHLVESDPDGTDLIYIDRIFLHERTGSIALTELAARGLEVFCPEHVFCTMDHIVDTFPDRTDNTLMPSGRDFIIATRQATTAAGIKLFDLDDPRQGIVHVVSPEQGIAQPGLSLVCPDSHTCTQGALGALAWGVGSSEAEHALATKTLRVRRPRTMRVRFEGALPAGVTAKDMALHLIGTHGAAGGAGCAVEFAGAAVRALDMEGRMTLCNMAVEFSAFTALVAPDETTFNYLRGRPHAPAGKDWDKALAYWRSLSSDVSGDLPSDLSNDTDADLNRGLFDRGLFDREIEIDCSTLEPQVTWGTSPEQVTGISGRVPGGGGEGSGERGGNEGSGEDGSGRAHTQSARGGKGGNAGAGGGGGGDNGGGRTHAQSARGGDAGTGGDSARALAYMGLAAGNRLAGTPLDAAFIGSCTNARISDLRAAANILKGRRVSPGLRAICVPGSMAVKAQAEQEGLDKVFTDAGFEWRASGCSMCFFAGGEHFGRQQRVLSTTNRNFESRQGPQTRTHLASPATVAASAVAGVIADPRALL